MSLSMPLNSNPSNDLCNILYLLCIFDCFKHIGVSVVTVPKKGMPEVLGVLSGNS